MAEMPRLSVDGFTNESLLTWGKLANFKLFEYRVCHICMGLFLCDKKRQLFLRSRHLWWQCEHSVVVFSGHLRNNVFKKATAEFFLFILITGIFQAVCDSRKACGISRFRCYFINPCNNILENIWKKLVSHVKPCAVCLNSPCGGLSSWIKIFSLSLPMKDQCNKSGRQ